MQKQLWCDANAALVFAFLSFLLTTPTAVPRKPGESQAGLAGATVHFVQVVCKIMYAFTFRRRASNAIRTFLVVIYSGNNPQSYFIFTYCVAQFISHLSVSTEKLSNALGKAFVLV